MRCENSWFLQNKESILNYPTLVFHLDGTLWKLIICSSQPMRQEPCSINSNCADRSMTHLQVYAWTAYDDQLKSGRENRGRSSNVTEQIEPGRHCLLVHAQCSVVRINLRRAYVRATSHRSTAARIDDRACIHKTRWVGRSLTLPALLYGWV